MKILTIGLCTATILTISACDTIERITVQKATDQTTVLSATAANSVSIVKASSDGDIVCMRHAPDALSSASLSVVARGKSADESENSANSEAELDGRTPVVLLVRDAQFELCNMYLNGVIDKIDYLKLYTRQLEIHASLMLEETKNTTITISETSASAAASSSIARMEPLDQSQKVESGSNNSQDGSNRHSGSNSHSGFGD